MKLKKMITLFLTLIFVLFSTTAVSSASDIDEHSLEEEMREAVEKGVMSGIGNGNYAPDRSVTRAEFSAFLVRSIELDAPTDLDRFPDVGSDNIFRSVIGTAAKAKIVGGYPDGTFKPDQEIDREQMAVMISRAIDVYDIDDIEGSTVFADEDDIHPNYRDQVYANAAFGIIQGSPAGNDTFNFHPKRRASRAEAAAFIVRTLDVIDTYYVPAPPPEESPAEEESPEEDPVEEPPVEEIIEDPIRFHAANVDENGDVKQEDTGYDSFEEAMSARSSSYPYVSMNDHLIWMNEGLVRTNREAGATITIYSNEALTRQATYITTAPQFSSEMEYVRSDGDMIEIKYAGKTGYIRSIDASLFPAEIVGNNRNYYSVNRQGELLHHYYRHDSGRHVGFNRLGHAPDFMQSNEQYYSLDGKSFKDSQGRVAGESINYFQNVPVLSETSYSAEELNDYIENGSPPLLDSPLEGYGGVFLEAEEKYGINALYLLANALHESAWGTSRIAEEKNNFFGIRATDSNPLEDAYAFESIEENILFAGEFIREGYANHADWRFEGSFLGNKGEGFNVRYASDMFWGQKIASHMYRADVFLGQKDINKLTVYETDRENLNVRYEPNTRRSAMYTYDKRGYPVTVTGERKNDQDELWYKIRPDHPDEEKAYIRSDLLRKVEFPE